MMRYPLLRTLAPLLLLFSAPSLALAHTKWFAHESLASYVTVEPTALYLAVW